MMLYKLLGKTGLRVSEICLGTMTFGNDWNWGMDKKISKHVFDVFSNAGGNFIDTANRYTEGTSEQFVGDFIHSDRDHFVVATKYSLYDRLHDVNFSGNHRKNMIRSVEASLKRLNTDYIDILYLHIWDFLTPMTEILRAMDDLVRSGKILYAGISDTPAWMISEANAIAELRGWTRFDALQVEYSLLQRTTESEYMSMAKMRDMAFTAWAPLAGGALSGKYLKGNDSVGRLQKDSTRLNERSAGITKVVVEVAKEIGCTPAQVAIRWVMQKKQVVIPVIGATKVEQMEDVLGVVDMELTQEQLYKLDEVSKISQVFPHDFFQQEGVIQVLYGGMKDKIHNHRT